MSLRQLSFVIQTRRDPLLYAASALPAISRINDDTHYFSQAFLGWWLAYLAESAVDRSHDPNANHRFFAYPHTDGLIVGVTLTR